MARVVLVHGAFNELWGPHELAARWTPALRDGLWHHGVSIGADDVAVAFYGDVFRADPEADGYEAFEASRAGAAELLQGMAGGDGLAVLHQAANEAVFDRTVDMVAMMTANPSLTDDIRARVEAVVGPETRVVVAHSLGTIVSYRVLCAHPEWQVDTFVTLGSPLGAPMVDTLLGPLPEGAKRPWPGSVRRWVNVAALGDKAAAVHRLADHFEGGVEDHRVDNGHRCHDPEPYLNSAVTGSAIAAALA